MGERGSHILFSAICALTLSVCLVTALPLYADDSEKEDEPQKAVRDDFEIPNTKIPDSVGRAKTHKKKGDTTKQYRLLPVITEEVGKPTFSPPVFRQDEGEVNNITLRVPLSKILEKLNETNKKVDPHTYPLTEERVLQETRVIYQIYRKVFRDFDFRENYIKGYRWYHGTDAKFREHAANLTFLTGTYWTMGGLDLALSTLMIANQVFPVLIFVSSALGIMMMAPIMDPLYRLMIHGYAKSDTFRRALSYNRKVFKKFSSMAYQKMGFSRLTEWVVPPIDHETYIRSILSPEENMFKDKMDEMPIYVVDMRHKDSRPLLRFIFEPGSDHHVFLTRLSLFVGPLSSLTSERATWLSYFHDRLDPYGWNVQEAVMSVLRTYLTNPRNFRQNVTDVKYIGNPKPSTIKGNQVLHLEVQSEQRVVLTPPRKLRWLKLDQFFKCK